MAIVALLMLLGSVATSAQTRFCFWEDLPCDSAVTYGNASFYVQVRANPPCSLFVQAYFSKKCNQYEIGDWKYYFDNLQPVGCMTKAEILANWNTVVESGYREFALRDANNRGPMPDCENGARLVHLAKPGSCSKYVIGWTLPGGGSHELEYTYGFPISYYDNMMLSMGGTGLYFRLAPCNEICCRRTYSFCVLPNGSVKTTMTTWSPVANVCGEISPLNPNPGNCVVKFCGD